MVATELFVDGIREFAEIIAGPVRLGLEENGHVAF